MSIYSDLRTWVSSHRIRQSALRDLLKIINERTNVTLSKDPRTIMKTPRRVEFIEIDDKKGLYWHQGLEVCLQRCFGHINKHLKISININIDGLPLHRSSKKTFWPILFNVQEYPEIRPMAIGIFYGNTKPSKVNEYLSPFVNEIEPILRNGIFINGHKVEIRIRCFICDSPARAFIKGFKFLKN